MLDGLNKEQHAAVTAPLQSMLVLAGAGSGKTRVLVSRIAWLIQTQHFSPQSILAVTFTNKAAGEMKGRLHQLLGLPTHTLWVGTFHGLCHRFLRTHHDLVGLASSFQILDTDDQGKMIKQLIKSMQLDEERWPVKVVQSYINAQKEEGLRAKDIHPLAYGPTKTYLALYQAYEKICQKQGLVDFAELMLRTCELFREHPELLAHYHTQFKAILVDEFQDTNVIQYTWIRLLASAQCTVMAVGDDDQSIYGWRGAKIENIQRFSEDFKGSLLIRLEQNYRSTSTILEAANTLIAHNETRMGKSLWTKGQLGSKIKVYGAFNEIEEANYVVRQIQAFLAEGERADAIACLYRSNAQSRVLEEAFIQAGIDYRIYGGVRFFERAEIKDAMAYLRLSLNPQDDLAFDRVVNVPPRGIGDKSLEHLETYASVHQVSLWEALHCLLEEDQTNFTARAHTALRGFQALIVNLSALMKNEGPLESQLSTLLEDSGLLAHYSKIKSDLASTKVDNLKEWVTAAKEFRFEATKEDNQTWPSAFLSHVALASGEMQSGEDVPTVHLMTIHAAKGLEFPVVFMVGVEEGIFPSRPSLEDDKKLEEERRLCYVGMTRAKARLSMSYAVVRRLYGREERHRPSRFISELPKQLVEQSGSMDGVRQQTAMPRPASRVEPSNYPYAIGQKVTHPRFGEGIVLAYEGGGVQMNIQVSFKNIGTKWLALAYAKLATEA